MNDTPSVVRFYRLIDAARPPRRADRSACGTLPTRATRYCEAATSASAFGWWVFSPLDIRVLWDGTDIFWHHAGASEWLPLQPSSQFPDFAARFDDHAPAELAGCAPPFLTALPEPGTLQIWTGLMVRTLPDWHLLVRAPANLPGPGGYTLYEGIIESDAWFGPLFTNLRLTRTDVPVRLRDDFPLIQVQPIPRAAYSNQTLSAMTVVDGLADWQSSDWNDYCRTIVTPNQDPARPFGRYATTARRRRGAEAVAASCPMARAALVD